MNKEVDEQFNALAAELGKTEYKIERLKEHVSKIIKRMENLEWVSSQAPVVPEVINQESDNE